MSTQLDLPSTGPIYPGHPITIAHHIMAAFASFEEADAPTCHNHSRAMGDARITGAGTNVHRAIVLLRDLHRGAPLDVVVTRAQEFWRDATSAPYADRYEEGVRQAEACLPLFDPAWWKPRERGAILDETRRYRYRLWRPTGLEGTSICAFLMLNPSTADENLDDNTIRKCVKYARTWGYARLVVVNLFAYRTKDPAVLKEVKDLTTAVGRDNDAFIDQICWPGPWRAGRIVTAWGGDGNHLDRDRRVLERLQATGTDTPIYYLKLSTSTRAFPFHPLYQRDDLTPVLYPWSSAA